MIHMKKILCIQLYMQRKKNKYYKIPRAMHQYYILVSIMVCMIFVSAQINNNSIGVSGYYYYHYNHSENASAGLVIGLFSLTDCFQNKVNTDIVKKEIGYRLLTKEDIQFNSYLSFDICNSSTALVETLMKIVFDLKNSDKIVKVIISYMSPELTIMAANILTVIDIPYRAMINRHIILSDALTNRFDALLYDEGISIINALDPYLLQWWVWINRTIHAETHSVRMCFQEEHRCFCEKSPAGLTNTNPESVFFLRNGIETQRLLNSIDDFTPNSTKYNRVSISIVARYVSQLFYLLRYVLRPNNVISFNKMYSNKQTYTEMSIPCIEYLSGRNNCSTMIDHQLISENLIWMWEPTFDANSTCLGPCEVGMTLKKYDDELKGRIVFTCVPCKNNSVKSIVGDEKCSPCPIGWISNHNYTRCYDTFQNLTLQFTDSFSVIMMSLSCTGFTGISTTMFLFLKHIKTPIVKSSNVMLSFVQLIAQLALTILLPFMFIGDPNVSICTLRPIVIAMLVPIVVGVTICKTHTLLGIYQRRILTKRDVKMKKMTEIFLLFLFVLISLGIVCVNIQITTPDIALYVSTVDQVREGYCTSNDQIVTLFIYFTVLLIISTVQAYRARHLPENLKETRVIALSSILMILLMGNMTWLYYYQASYYKKRLFVYFAACSLNLISFWVLYAYKVYILIFRPEINTKQYFNVCIMRRVSKDSKREIIKINASSCNQQGSLSSDV